jgi:predicted DNA-binding protein
MKDYYQQSYRFEKTTHMRVPKKTRQKLRELKDKKERSMMNIMANLVREEYFNEVDSPRTS